ncbi:MAG: serine/threonine protein kinase, partial [Myxococcales bacterium]|nr:serine/threonine protein kinase [Myxococcales bacterium]
MALSETAISDEVLGAPRVDRDTLAADDVVDRGGAAAPTLPRVDRSRYQVSGELARGGLGRILRARDRHLDRTVALKEMLGGGPEPERRFVREALITARLEHPSIVPVHDAGRGDDGAPFYAMKLVRGRPLADVAAAATTTAQRLALVPTVLAVADALAYAHSEKVIHRDLKPHNVLVGEFGETVVIDWGLAKDLGAGDDDVVVGGWAAAPDGEAGAGAGA